MNLSKKIDIVRTALRSISEHTDEDSVIRTAALVACAAAVEAEKAKIVAEVEADTVALAAGE
jgi:hypothetical protein